MMKVATSFSVSSNYNHNSASTCSYSATPSDKPSLRKHRCWQFHVVGAKATGENYIFAIRILSSSALCHLVYAWRFEQKVDFDALIVRVPVVSETPWTDPVFFSFSRFRGSKTLHPFFCQGHPRLEQKRPDACWSLLLFVGDPLSPCW